MEQNLQNRHSNLVQISDSVALRLKEFTNLSGRNPDHMADLILTQWMDNQIEMYGSKWNLTGRKGEIMRGGSFPLILS